MAYCRFCISFQTTFGGGGNSTNTLSIVVPCYNESRNIHTFYTKALEQITKIQTLNPSIACEFIFVDDGSSDETLRILEDLSCADTRVKFLSFSRNFGKESAILAGLRASRGDCVVLIDADLQHPVELIWPMYEAFYTQHIDVVYARRINRDGEGRIRAWLSKMFYKVYGLLSSVGLESGVSDFRLMSRKVVDSVLSLNETHRFCKGLFEWVGFEKKCLCYRYIPRDEGKSSWNLWKLSKYAIDGIIGFSTLPLRIPLLVGGCISGGAIVYGICIMIDTFLYGNPVQGYASLICLILFLGGLNLMVVGIVGEYIARIYEQSKNRPHYLIKKKNF